MQASAYYHGPHVIAPWFQYLQDDKPGTDLTSAAGRMKAAIDLFISAQTLPDDAETYMSVLKQTPFFVKNEWKFGISVPTASAFRKSTHAIIGELDLPRAELAPTSYAPVAKSTSRRHARQAA